MTAVLSVYGRLGQDPKAISTTSGKPMAVASMAVDIPTRGEDHHSEWFGLVAFGELAERLLKHQAGELIGAGLKPWVLPGDAPVNGALRPRFSRVFRAPYRLQQQMRGI